MTDPISKGRRQLILLASVFFGPLLFAFVFYYGDIGWRPLNSTENGQLISPPRLLPDIALRPDTNGESPKFRGKWSLIMLGDGDCDETCFTRLYETRQVRKALSRDRDRVQRVFYLTGGTLDPEFIKREHPGLVIIETDAPIAKALLEAVSDGNREPGDIFLADPIGNLIMRFPRDTDMREIHTDLKQILKLSRIG
jgi:hypothetical protein